MHACKVGDWGAQHTAAMHVLDAGPSAIREVGLNASICTTVRHSAHHPDIKRDLCMAAWVPHPSGYITREAQALSALSSS